MADPKKNPLIGAFRAPVPGASRGGKTACRWSRQAYRREERTGGPQGPCEHYSQAR